MFGFKFGSSKSNSRIERRSRIGNFVATSNPRNVENHVFGENPAGRCHTPPILGTTWENSGVVHGWRTAKAILSSNKT